MKNTNKLTASEMAYLIDLSDCENLTDLERKNIMMLAAMQHDGMYANMFGIDFEEKKIRISQWPNGKHYYAKYDGVDVEIDGVIKWKTYKDAYKAAIEFGEQ